MHFDPRPPLPPQRLAWTTVVVCFLALVVGLLLQMFNLPFGLWFTEIFGLFGVAWALTRWSGRAPARYVRLSWPGLPAALFAAGLSLANYFGLAIPLQGLSRALLPKEMSDAFDVSHAFLQLSPVDFWLVAVAAVLVAAVCEEFVFRGVVQQGLGALSPHPAQAVVRTALIFSLFHLNPVTFVALFEVGLFLGLLYLRTGSLVPGIVAHATQNAVAMVLFLLERDLPSTATADPTWRTFVGLSGMGLVVLVMLLQVGKWFPAVWGRRQPAEVELPRVPLARALAPWLVAASVALLGWSALDRHGVELGVADLRVKLPPQRASETAELRSARDALETLRAQVRSGRAPLQSYLDQRRALAETLAGASSPPGLSPAPSSETSGGIR